MDSVRSELMYENVGGNSDELERAIRLCLMGSDLLLPLTCLGEDARTSGTIDFERAWEEWRTTLFAKSLASHLVKIFAASQRGDAKAIIAIDCALGKELPPDVAERSALAGCQMRASMDGARHVKVLDKLDEAIRRHDTAGHHSTFFASEAAMFNVPMMHLLPAYLFAEWRTARLMLGMPMAGDPIELFQSHCREALDDARHVLSTTVEDCGTLSVCA